MNRARRRKAKARRYERNRRLALVHVLVHDALRERGLTRTAPLDIRTRYLGGGEVDIDVHTTAYAPLDDISVNFTYRFDARSLDERLYGGT